MKKKIGIVSSLVVVFAMVLFFGSCKKMPNGGVPFYIFFDSTTVEITNPAQGTAHHKILDVWVEAGAENRGAYELPRGVPILQSDKVRVVTFAGIADNGDDDIRVKYPFLRIDTFTVYNPVLGDTVVHHSKYRYYDNLSIWNESFEFVNKFTNVSVVANSDCEGVNAGKINFQNDTTAFAYQTSASPIQPVGKGDVYVELEYKFDVPVEVGMTATVGATSVDLPLMVLSEKTTWNKIYLNFSYLVGYNPADNYRLYFKAKKDANSTANLWIDNVKLIYFNN